MRARSHPPRSEAGFSLVEMLASLAILGLVALVLSAGIGGVAAAMRRQAVARDAQDQVQAAQVYLRRRLERVAPLVDTQGGGSTVDMAGGSVRLDFVGPAPDRNGPDALQRYRLVRREGGELTLFTMSTLAAGTDPRDPGLSGWTPAALLNGTAGLAIQYFGPVRGGGTVAAWQDSWLGRQEAPALIRIRVAFAPGDARIWPDLLVRPRGGGISGCEIHADSGRCGDQS